MAYIIIKYIQI